MSFVIHRLYLRSSITSAVTNTHWCASLHINDAECTLNFASCNNCTASWPPISATAAVPRSTTSPSTTTLLRRTSSVGGAAGEHQHSVRDRPLRGLLAPHPAVQRLQVIPGFTDVSWNKCHGPYENAAPAGSEKAEPGDAFCYPRGDTHVGQAPPNIVTGCLDNVLQNGEFDGPEHLPVNVQADAADNGRGGYVFAVPDPDRHRSVRGELPFPGPVRLRGPASGRARQSSSRIGR
jgi:hypothetical protein